MTLRNQSSSELYFSIRIEKKIHETILGSHKFKLEM